MKQRALLRLWLQDWGVTLPSLVQLEQIISDVIFAKADAQPQFRLHDKIVRRYQNRLFLTSMFTDISQEYVEAKFNHPISLPDHLGTLLLKKTREKMTALWQDEWANTSRSVKFTLSGNESLDSISLFGQGEINPKRRK